MNDKIEQITALRQLSKNYSLFYDESSDSLSFECCLSEVLLDSLKKDFEDFRIRFNNNNVRKGLHLDYIGENVSIIIVKGELISERNIYETWDIFLSKKANLCRCPELFWIISDDLFYNKADDENEGNTTQTSKVMFKNYLDACSLMSLFFDIADYKENENDGVVDCFVVISKSKLEIDPNYNKDDLSIGLDGITLVLKEFEDAIHYEYKKNMFKEALYILLNNIPKAERLSFLFKNFGELSTNFISNYTLFVSEFSFDSVRIEYEESKRDYIVKLNEILSSVQTKMLGIPISLAFLSLKYDSNSNNVTEAAGDIFRTHVMLNVGILIYCGMMYLLIKNQFHTLSAVKEEYTGLMNRLKIENISKHSSIRNIVINLDKRHDFQWRTLAFFNLITIGLFLTIIYLILGEETVTSILNFPIDIWIRMIDYYSNLSIVFLIVT